MLCTPCRAALKRAHHRTVQELPQYVAPVPRLRGRRRAAALAAHAEPPKRSRAGRRIRAEIVRRTLLATTAVAALAGVAYLGQPEWAASIHDTPAPAPAAPVPLPRPGTAGDARDTLPAMPFVPPPKVQAATATVARPAATRAAEPRARAEATALVAYPAPDSFGPVAEAPRPDAPPPAAPRPAPPPPDRWQQLSDALAQCEREGGLSGFICDQRVRLDACEGWWGRVAQCPLPPENPR